MVAHLSKSLHVFPVLHTKYKEMRGGLCTLGYFQQMFQKLENIYFLDLGVVLETENP